MADQRFEPVPLQGGLPAMEAAGVGMALVGYDGRIVRANRMIREMFGSNGQELIGQEFSVFVPDEDRIAFLESFRNVHEAGDLTHRDWRMPLRGGELIWVRVTPSLVMGEDGTPMVLTVLTDISDSRRQQDALAESQARMRAVVNSALDCIITMDEEGRICEFNPAAVDTFGYTQKQALGKYVADLIIPEELRESHWQGLRRFLTTDKAKLIGKRIEVEALRSDGTRFPVELALSVARAPAGTFFTAYIRDIADRKGAEAEIVELTSTLERRVEERTAALMEANKEMQGFTYSISHDLRAPLRAIMSSSMILLEDHSQNLNEDGKTELRRQARAAKKLGDLIDDLLKLSRISRHNLERTLVDLSELASSIIEDLKRADADAEFRVQADMLAHADENLIRLALQNLIENAVKFCKPGQTPVVEIGQSGPAQFFVRDNGIGIGMEYAHKVFLPFERLVTDQEYEGTGIGLANAQRVIERHNGEISVDSHLGKGSTFTFTLPV